MRPVALAPSICWVRGRTLAKQPATDSPNAQPATKEVVVCAV